MENFYYIEEIEWILHQFEEKLSKYSVKEYKINNFEKVLLVEDSFALFISIREDKDTCICPNYGETIYGLDIEEISYNDIGFKYNHSEFLRFVKRVFKIEYF